MAMMMMDKYKYMVTEDMSTCHIPTILKYDVARITYTPLIGAMQKRNHSFLQDMVPEGCDYHVIHLVLHGGGVDQTFDMFS